jgi:hypothetical protein
MAANNTLTVSDARALQFLSDNDELEPTDVLDAFNLIPDGSGLAVDAQAEGGVYLGGPFGRHFTLGLSAQGRGYGGGIISKDAVALLRDGNATRQDFDISDTQGATLGSLEAGVHALLRFGPIGSEDGALLTLGLGGRKLWPQVYGHVQSQINTGVHVTGDSIAANIGIDVIRMDDVEFGLNGRGSGLAGDFLMRIEWPTSGFALEAMVANVGTVTIDSLIHEQWIFNVDATSLTDVLDALDAEPATAEIDLPDFVLTTADTSVTVTLPRIVRFGASAWANRILQIDVGATLPVRNVFDVPLSFDLGTTWRFIRTLPLHAGLIVDARHGVGYTGGLGIESRNFLFRAYGGSLGGFFRNARGAGGRFELGFFF